MPTTGEGDLSPSPVRGIPGDPRPPSLATNTHVNPGHDASGPHTPGLGVGFGVRATVT